MARLTPIISIDQVTAEDRGIAEGIIASRGTLQGPMSLFMYCPELAGRVADAGAYVRFEGDLDMRVRVLAAMTVAREFEAMYVWGAQSGNARRQNVAEATIDAIRAKHAQGVPAEDAQIMDFTRALLTKHRVTDAEFAAIRSRFGEKQLIELTGTIGYYSMLCMTVNACQLEPGEGAEVLKV